MKTRMKLHCCHHPTGLDVILIGLRLLFSHSIVQCIHQTLKEEQELNECKSVEINFSIIKIIDSKKKKTIRVLEMFNLRKERRNKR